MPNRCVVCEEELDINRIKALLDIGKPLHEWTCVKDDRTPKVFGFMCPSGETTGTGKTYGKTGQVLVTVSADNKEALRKALRFNSRAR